MKGLVYREACLLKKTAVTNLRVSAMFMILGWMVLLSAEYGNIAKYLPDFQQSLLEHFNLFIYAVMMVLGSTAEGAAETIFRDQESGWIRFSHTLPVSIRLQVGIRYLVIWGIVFVAFLCGTLNAVLVQSVSGKSCSVSMVVNLLMIGLLMADFCMVSVWLAIRMKNRNLLTMCMTIFFLLLVSGFILWCWRIGALEEGGMNILTERLEQLHMLLYGVIIGLTVLVTGGTYYDSVRAY